MNIGRVATILILGAVFLVLGYALFLIYITWPISEFSINKAGVFGDSFGILTSLFSALAFTGLIITILLQRQELILQRNELEETRREITGQKEILRLQNFNNAFYRLLDYYKTNLEQISITEPDKSEVRTGIDSLRYLLGRFSKSQSEYKKYYSIDDEEKTKVYEYYLCKNIHRILLKQSRYLGTFESLLHLVDSQLESDSDKAIYWKIIESQLTVYEVQYLFYRSLVDINGSFSKLIHKSNILLERVPSVGIPESAKEVYKKLHGIKYEHRDPFKIKLPYQRKLINKIKRRVDRENLKSRENIDNFDEQPDPN